MDEYEASQLPRLLVVSDVNVERTMSGALVLYRLLKQYPAQNLMVLARPNDGSVDRVTGAVYRDLWYRIPRLALMRFNPFWPVVMAKYVRHLTPRVLADVSEFRPEAVLSVAEGYLCFVADAVANRLRIPLHMILHDDWTFHQTLRHSRWTKPAVRWACDRVIGPVLRRAATRFCVSPGMAEQYSARFHVDSTVLYPSRGEDSPVPTVRVTADRSHPLRAAYAGTIHHAWVVASLCDGIRNCNGWWRTGPLRP